MSAEELNGTDHVAEVIDTKEIVDYLRDVVPLLLGGGEASLADTLAEAEPLLTSFAADPNKRALMVHRNTGKSDQDDQQEIIITDEIKSLGASYAACAFVKKNPKDPLAPNDLALQLHCVVFSDGKPFGMLHALVQQYVQPFFNSLAKGSGAADKESIKPASKAINELETLLSHLQQDTDIPQIEIVPEKAIAAAVSEARKAGRSPTLADMGDLVHDDAYVKSLERVVLRWIKDIQQVTRLERDLSTGSARQEIRFWLSMERALSQLKVRLAEDDVTLTLAVLREAKRLTILKSFETDTNLSMYDTVLDYNTLMKDFPINAILIATDIKKLVEAMLEVFQHMKKVKHTRYPRERFIELIKAISRDVNSQLLKILSKKKLMHMPIPEFENLYNQCNQLFREWNDKSDFRTIIQELRSTQRGGRATARRVVPEHKALQERLALVHDFRLRHDDLKQRISVVLKQRGIEPDADEDNALAEVENAYDEMRSVDVLDLEEEGQRAWDRACESYEARVNQVEDTIIKHLCHELDHAAKSSDMFRIFRHYYALLDRPRIRNAVRSYQKQLMSNVKDDIIELHKKFKMQYHNSNNSHMSAARDIPPTSGQIIWMAQIERQLDDYLERVGHVLGPNWMKHVDGRELKERGETFKEKLRQANPYDLWLQEIETQDITFKNTIFDIELFRGEKTRLEMFVNFHERLITMAKEVRIMGWLKNVPRVPKLAVVKAKKANMLYPYVISLKNSIKTYSIAMNQLDDRPHLTPLVARWYNRVHDQIAYGMDLTWESPLEAYAYELSRNVTELHRRVQALFGYDDRIKKMLTSLTTCDYSNKKFQDLIKRGQDVLNKMKAEKYVNLQQWCDDLNAQVEQKLAARLHHALVAWTKALAHASRAAESWDADVEDDEDLPEIARAKHELQIRNQVIMLTPPVESARQALVQQLQVHLSVVTSLARLHTDPLDTANATKSVAKYGNLLAKLPNDGADLVQAHRLIDVETGKVDAYVGEWLQYQSLWDLQMENVFASLGDDLMAWQQLLTEIKRARRHFDTSETSKALAAVDIEYSQVQTRVAMKYDAIHREIIGHFATSMADHMSRFYNEVHGLREKLEAMSLEAAKTSDSITYIGVIQGAKKRVKPLTAQFECFVSGEKLLERQRFPFPSDWLRVQQLEGEWEAFLSILERRHTAIAGQVTSLQMRVVSEERQIEAQIAELVADWDKNKPMGGDVNPAEAVNVLNIFQGRFTRLRDEYENLVRAKTALDLDIKEDTRLPSRMEELMELKGSWHDLSRVVEHMSDLKATEWGAVVPTKLRSQLNGIVDELKRMPARVKSYEAYEYLLQQARSYIKVNETISVLRGDTLTSRHWKMLTSELGVSWDMVTLTLGQVWAVDLERNAEAINRVVLQAQGEKALEVFLKQIKEAWQAYELEMVNYQNKTKLIKGWDDLFTLAKDHINNLAQMKLSPYYKVFEEEALAWENRLNTLYTLFYDVWIDVQRQWVYLEGIFTGSADLKVLLPTETNKFMGLSNEFVALMRKVSKNPMVLEVLNIPNLERTLHHFKDVLDKIQKALSKYLEQERASFPRFYFVGDEDLLDIIGNGKNVDRIQKHFRKMFAGLNSVELTEQGDAAKALLSREGEVVPFTNNVQVKDRKINAWLTALEEEMKVALASLLNRSTTQIKHLATSFELSSYLKWLDAFQAQIVVLSAQVAWSESVQQALVSGGGKQGLKEQLDAVITTLNALADTVLQHQPPIRRKKLEQMITELVHKRDLTRGLIDERVAAVTDFRWLQNMRFEFDAYNTDVLQQLSIKMADVSLFYGFEYLGLVDKLVQTPLTDRCFLTMTQALAARQGGSPFGPAGTGKTESVKALGAQLGRFVLVFNCDETFDNHAMGRIFVGLCQVGAWGCFDEFNRLEESMLSAVSQQIESIQLAIKAGGMLEGEAARQAMTVSLQGRTVSVNPSMAIFITMNPGYAGRSPLPDNLKKLFRNLAMTKPDRQLIAQVMLFSQGFRTAEQLSRKVVPLFILCQEQLSAQSHYDFGLRSLKAVLVSAGNIKRERLAALRQKMREERGSVDEEEVASAIDEQEVVIQSITQTMIPKLVAQDIPLLDSLLTDVFPGVQRPEIPLAELEAKILEVCEEQHYVPSKTWLNKVLQVYQVTQLNHGLMLVGPSGVGKSVAWRVLLEALRRLEQREAEEYVIDPKAITKEELYGFLDPTTREWTDGLFTSIVRKVIDDVRGERNRRQWIIFDGDVDPEWVENLNSVLDDNKLLTLPNGERLNLPSNIRILFEVQDLKNATLATVSRCGMIWFSEDVLTLQVHYKRFLRLLRNVPVDSDMSQTQADKAEGLAAQRKVADTLEPFFEEDGLVTRSLQYARSLFHVMDYTDGRCINALFSMLNQTARSITEYNATHPDFQLTEDQVKEYTSKRFMYSLMWCLVGDSRGDVRTELSRFLTESTTVELPPVEQGAIIDFKVTLPDAQWQPWTHDVPRIEIEAEKVSGTSVVVPTLDTVRHEDLLYTWLSEHLPIVLCGPPGSGKTMTLFSALRALPHFEVAGLNFSSSTTPELIMKTFDQYCEYRTTPNGLVLAPAQLNKWLVIFMDECNLPAPDKYNTVRVITFIRQLVEHGGFWRTEDRRWVKLERIQFVGACNPPTDPGRVPLAHRFLRHVPVVYVDYPGAESLRQIYGTFNRAILRMHPSLERYADNLTDAMVSFYSQSQRRFTADVQPHYIYSPREMTRWVKGVAEAITPLARSGTPLDLNGLVRVWAHEALRLFQDRLVGDDERQWTDEKVDDVAKEHFPGIDMRAALQRPILFSDWLTHEYGPVDQEDLREFVREKLKSFTEEQVDLNLVLFDEVLDHVLRIDRVFRQNQGHMLLIGVSGCGRTTLSRFVAWMNQLTVVQIKSHNLYTPDDFDADLRELLKRSGVEGEKIVFILDESNITDTAFLERMNTLLANGEVPGLFEGDDFSALMTKCKEASRRQNLHLDDNEELYRWFSQNVMDNLHIVFTMCPAEGGMQDRATTSPALFNRCVLDWFGDWPDSALFRVAAELSAQVPLAKPEYEPPMDFPVVVDALQDATPSHADAVHNAAVFVHKTAKAAARQLLKQEGRSTDITPRHFLEFVAQLSRFHTEKRKDLEAQKSHLLNGVTKIDETRDTVAELQVTLAEKKQQLEAKSKAAKEKLDLMLSKKQAANAKREESLNIDKELQAKQEQADARKAEVEAELAAVAPAVEEAKAAVKGIKKRDLQEIRTLAKPPQAVQVALEGVVTLLGKHTTDWKKIRSIIAQDHFTSDVMNFDSNSITSKIMGKMESSYLTNELFTFEKANRASKAAGPLVKWANAQMAYAKQLLKVEPLNNELRQLEEESMAMREQQDALQVLVAELEETIKTYEAEYAVLISEQEAIKNDLTTVSDKVSRSEKLLENLASEKDRWTTSAADFDAQMSTIIGDCLISAAFVGYAGYFDQSYRSALLARWITHLSKARIEFKPGVEDGIPEYLSSPDDRLRWKTNALPEDELCSQNAVMLSRSIRTPLVIDPAGQAAEFIMREYNADNKMVVTSFLDPVKLRKDVESAIRFGTDLLIQDAEKFDALLNPILTNDVQRKGGRIMINLAGKDIDLSPTFSMKLITKNPAVQFPMDICSRVTLINFTVTPGSLQTQCLNQALRYERPDVDEQRTDLLRQQGEFRLELLNLENQLLDALNKAEGSILDDDKVITHLEKLKNRAMEVQAKVDETDTVMATVEKTSRMYQPLAQRCSSIYFTLQQMAHMHFLYQYSLRFFLDIFLETLQANPRLEGLTDHDERLRVINDSLFQFVYERVAPGMMHEHRLPLALTFARFRVEGTDDQLPEKDLRYFLSGGGVLLGKSDFAFLVPSAATEEQANALHQLRDNVPAFGDLLAEIKGHQGEFAHWIALARPELELPKFVSALHSDAPQSVPYRLLRELLFLQAARPDRLLAHMHVFVEHILGKGFASSSSEADLQHVVTTEIKASVPVLLCGVKGFDTSVKVDDCAAAAGKDILPIAVGSADARREAIAAVTAGISSGRWVMLKNVHLAPDLLTVVEKKLTSTTPHPDFRLFLTSEISPKLPINMIRAARVFLYEAAAGVKASVKRTLLNFHDRVDAAPKQRGMVYLLLAWFHAVTQERLRYAPLGWSKRYEFGEPDLRTSADTIDKWIDRTSNGQASVDAADLPWEAMRTLLSKSVYGGRIDNEIDQRLLDAFVDQFFTQKSFSPKFCFVEAGKDSNVSAIKPPKGTTRTELLHWADSLPDGQLPTWLGLPANAEVVLLTNRAKMLTVNTMKLQTTTDVTADLGELADEGAASTAAWMRQLQEQANQWLGILPTTLHNLKRTEASIKDPMFRFYERETTIGVSLLKQVRTDLQNVIQCCEGEIKQTNHMRNLMHTLVQGTVYKTWLRYKVPEGMPVTLWIADFSLRVKQLHEIAQHMERGASLDSFRVWIGGLFVPEAFITATRQAVAQRNSWPLEALTLALDVRASEKDVPSDVENSFFVTALRIEGAACKNRTVHLEETPFTNHALTIVRWVYTKEGETDLPTSVQIPLYLNVTRANLIAVVQFQPQGVDDPQVFYRRGVALMCSSLTGVVA